MISAVPVRWYEMIKDDLAVLYQIQQVDSAIDKREALLAGMDDGTAAGQALEEAQAALDEAAAGLKSLQPQHRDLELELQGIDDEKREKRDRAYSGMVGDPKELTSLEAKLEELGRNTDRVEDLILAKLEEIEQAQAAVDDATAARDAATATRDEIVAVYDHQTQKARAELEVERAKREELVPGVSPAVLTQYDTLRERLGGIAIAAVSADGICEGCHVSVSRSNIMRVKLGNVIVKCESCRRMLCVTQ